MPAASVLIPHLTAALGPEADRVLSVERLPSLQHPSSPPRPCDPRHGARPRFALPESSKKHVLRFPQRNQIVLSSSRGVSRHHGTCWGQETVPMSCTPAMLTPLPEPLPFLGLPGVPPQDLLSPHWRQFPLLPAWVPGLLGGRAGLHPPSHCPPHACLASLRHVAA